MNITSAQTYILLSKFRKQQNAQDIETTMGPCPICGKGSRGGDWCLECLKSEFQRRGVGKNTLFFLEGAIKDFNRASSSIESFSRMVCQECNTGVQHE